MFSFGVNETLNAQGVDIQNGEALVVVFMLPSGATTTIGILDGVSSASGDAASIAFANPLDTSASGFAAEMRIGVGHSFDGADQNNPNSANQISQITVNGSTSLTNAAGHCDDTRDSACTNGNLITMGGDNAVAALRPIRSPSRAA